MTSEFVLPDVLEHQLITVICGRAPSNESARQSAYYAHFSNKFWKILSEVRLTDRRLDPSEFRRLPTYRIGLTDINKIEVGSDHELTGKGDDLAELDSKILKYKPRMLAFNGKTNARMYFHYKFNLSKSANLAYGHQQEFSLEKTEIHVLPSTSARAQSYWDSQYWFKLAERHFEIVEELS